MDEKISLLMRSPLNDTRPLCEHVSFTEPGWRSDLVELLAAARRWRSPASTTLDRSDVEACFENAMRWGLHPLLAVRGTVHPETGPYSPRIENTATRIRPWRGVAISTPNEEILTEHESRTYQDFERRVALHLVGDEAPFFYRSPDR